MEDTNQAAEQLEEQLFREAEYQMVKLADMHPAEYNPRFDLQPGDIAYDRLKKSVILNGMIQPIVWNRRTGNIVGGHQRYKVLMELGATETICAVVDKSLEDEMAANLAMNKAKGRDDDERLRLMLEQMDMANVDLDAMGFDQGEVDHILAGMDTLTEDEIFDFSQEPEKKPPMIKCPCCGKKFEERENRV